MCDRLAVMQLGQIVEIMTAAQLRGDKAEADYSRQLIAASLGR